MQVPEDDPVLPRTLVALSVFSHAPADSRCVLRLNFLLVNLSSTILAPTVD